MNRVHFLSKSAEWETPATLFDRLNEKWRFTLDVCANQANAKCEQYLDVEIDGLTQPWAPHVCWMNPPYGRVIGKWVQKAYEESQRGATVVCLLPARTDTRWFHAYCLKAESIEYIRGRLKFVNAPSSAPFPSMLVVFR